MAQSEAPHVRGFLFADLRGYTRFVEIHGDRAASELLSAYRTLVRAAVANFSGAEIRTEGDGFYVVFPSASSAIRCALRTLDEAASSTAAAGGPLPVGIGIHAGETEDSAEGFVGSAVNIAARVCAVAGPGELLITETVRGLIRTSMPLAIEVRGRRHLKGIREPISLFAVRRVGAPPPSRSHRLRSRAALTVGQRPVLAAFAALAGVAAVATVVLAVGLLTKSVANPGAGRLPVASGSAASASGAGSFPNADETNLLARLNPAITGHCARADPADRPKAVNLGGSPFVIRMRAGLVCKMIPSAFAPSVVYYWIPADQEGTGYGVAGLVSAKVLADAGIRSIKIGDCAAETRAYGRWQFGGSAGWVLCHSAEGDAIVEWTVEGPTPVLAIAVRHDGDSRALYDWWRDNGRSLAPP